MSTATLAPPTPPSHRSVPTGDPDADVGRRWIAWTARGRAHQRSVRRRSRIVAIVIVAMAAAALVAYGFLLS